MSERPINRLEGDDFIVEYYENGRFRLFLDTRNPDKIPRFRQALDCIEMILKLPVSPCRRDDEIDGDWAE